MNCPYCKATINKVIDKRAAGSGEIRRRRECLKCKNRFTTYERVSRVEILVIKRDGRKELYQKLKLQNGIVRALEKRPAFERISEITDTIERKLITNGTKELQSKVIGRTVLAELKKIDKVAYLRFASVYRHFNDPKDFAKEITHSKLV